MSESDEHEATSVACQLWQHLNECEWDAARELLADDFESFWPQSREKIVGPDNFISVNREYPGQGEIQVLDHKYSYDRWDKMHHITTVVRISWTMPDGKKDELHGISFFEIDLEGIIHAVTEYWADDYLAPEWRKQYVETY